MIDGMIVHMARNGAPSVSFLQEFGGNLIRTYRSTSGPTSGLHADRVVTLHLAMLSRDSRTKYLTEVAIFSPCFQRQIASGFANGQLKNY